MRGVISSKDDANFVLEHKPMHQAILSNGLHIVNLAHSGRTLYTTYSDGTNFRIVQWQWDNDEGWQVFLYK